MANRRLITDRLLKALPPAPRGQRVEVFDARLPGFGIRISDTKDADPARRGKAGRISFILFTRFAAGAAPTRRVIGTYGAVSLEEARRTAGEWRSLIAKGIDPAVIEAEAREKADRERALRIRHSFASVAEVFIIDKLSQERAGKMVERDFRSVFIAAWGDRPVSEITKLDVLEIISAKKRTAPQMARSLLIMIKRFFNWVIDQHVYGLTTSPCDRLSRAKIIGEPPSRSRRLTDAELFAFWRATGRMKYPIGPAYRMLLLTGLRLNECAKISWPEVHGDHVIIPAERMKGKNGRAREHLVPLSSTALEVLASLPRYRGGRYLFSFSAGDRPVAMASPAKRDLDRRMLRTLKAMARRRGEDHHPVTLPNWTNHDLRRVVRSGLSQLRVPHNVAEAVLAHKPPGIVGVYDLHEYQVEKAEALEAWAQRLKSTVNPVPAAAPARQSRQAAEAAAMNNYLEFTYSDEQWDQIRTLVRDRLGLDADQIERQDTWTRKQMKSLRGCLESAACRHIWRSARESQTPGHKARVKQLTALRDRAKALGTDFYDTISPSVTIGDMRYRSVLHLADVERAISMLVSVAEAHIAAQPQPTANTSKTGRDRFWNEALAFWTSIGGVETGIAAAEFLVAVSKPVFRSVRAIHGHKTAASTPQYSASVVEWLRRRAKDPQVAAS